MKLRLVGQQTKHTKIQEVIEKKTTEQNANRSDNKPKQTQKQKTAGAPEIGKMKKWGKSYLVCVGHLEWQTTVSRACLSPDESGPRKTTKYVLVFKCQFHYLAGYRGRQKQKIRQQRK